MTSHNEESFLICIIHKRRNFVHSFSNATGCQTSSCKSWFAFIVFFANEIVKCRPSVDLQNSVFFSFIFLAGWWVDRVEPIFETASEVFKLVSHKNNAPTYCTVLQETAGLFYTRVYLKFEGVLTTAITLLSYLSVTFRTRHIRCICHIWHWIVLLLSVMWCRVI